MAQYWKLSPARDTGVSISLEKVSHLLSRLGRGGSDAAAESLLSLLSEHVALAQCTIFGFDGDRRPRVLAVGDRSRTLELPSIADAYVRRYYRLDPLAEVMRSEHAFARRQGEDTPAVYLQRQMPTDIHHEGYRRTCYERPSVAERIAVLALYEGRRWLSVHLYRGVEHGAFSGADVRCIEQFAPLIVQAVRLHHSGQSLRHDLPEELEARLAEQYPELTQRDHDVLRALMEGLDTVSVAIRLGITTSSAQTYCKRLYRKLGVNGKGELMALVLQGKH